MKITLKKSEPQVDDPPSATTHYWFTITAANGEIVHTSEMHTRKVGCERGVRALATIFSALFRTSHSGAQLAVDDLFAQGRSGSVELVDATGE